MLNEKKDVTNMYPYNQDAVKNQDEDDLTKSESMFERNTEEVEKTYITRTVMKKSVLS